jgi:hypothetical protein
MVSVLFYKNSTKVYKNNSTCINNCHYNEIYNYSLHYLIKLIKSILYIWGHLYNKNHIRHVKNKSRESGS